MTSFPEGGTVRTNGVVRYSFMLWNAFSYSSSHTKVSPFLTSLENGMHLSDRLEMNLQLYAYLLVALLILLNLLDSSWLGWLGFGGINLDGLLPHDKPQEFSQRNSKEAL